MKTKFQPQNARELALVALEGVVENGAYSNLQVDQLLKKYPLADKDRRLATNIIYGVLQHKPYPRILAKWVCSGKTA